MLKVLIPASLLLLFTSVLAADPQVAGCDPRSGSGKVQGCSIDKPDVLSKKLSRKKEHTPQSWQSPTPELEKK